MRDDLHAFVHRREKRLGYGEIQLDRADVVERRDNGLVVDEAARAHAAQTDAAGKRRTNARIREPRFRRFDLCFIDLYLGE